MVLETFNAKVAREAASNCSIWKEDLKFVLQAIDEASIGGKFSIQAGPFDKSQSDQVRWLQEKLSELGFGTKREGHLDRRLKKVKFLWWESEVYEDYAFVSLKIEW